MSTPVAAVSSAPTFGGLTGYKRPLLGNPTKVPSNLPSFRGRRTTPGSDVKAPRIENSKNRQDRGTNVTIPYARICPIDHESDLGRIQKGDVVFTSRYQVDVSHVNFQRKERVVGIDYLNRKLGSDGKQLPMGVDIHPNWSVGKTVVLGGNTSDNMDKFDDIGSMMADNWREASFLRDWCCDGIVMSNDEPYVHTSNGANDVQQFNICIQGPSMVNNGYVDSRGYGVEAYPRSMVEFAPMHKHGQSVSIGSGPYRPSYPMQMFDRKVKPLSTLYVGLVATKRLLTDEIKAALLKNSPHLNPESRDYKILSTPNSEDFNYLSFYTFKFVCFSDRAARQNGTTRFGMQMDAWQYSEEPGKNQMPIHAEDYDPSKHSSFDPFEPVSMTEYRGMVGAWKIGKVMDIAASRKDTYFGGPIDTAEKVTVNVCIEWCDWRALRRITGRDDIAGLVSGAPMWLQTVRLKAPPNKTPKGGTPPITYIDDDDKRMFHWPTQYNERGSKPRPKDGKKDYYDNTAKNVNVPVNPVSEDSTEDKIKSYETLIKNTREFILNPDNPKSYRLVIAIMRKTAGFESLSPDELDKFLKYTENKTAKFSNDTVVRQNQFVRVLKDANNIITKEDFAVIQKMFGKGVLVDWNSWTTKGQRPSDTAIKRMYRMIEYFTDDGKRTAPITKQMMLDFFAAKPPDTVSKGPSGQTPQDLENIGQVMEEGVNRLIDFEVAGTSMDVEETSSTAPTSAPTAAARVSKPRGKSPAKTSAKQTPTVPTVSTGAAASGSKPTAKPAAKAVVAPSAPSAPATSTAAPTEGAATTAATDPGSTDIFSAIFGASAGAAENSDTDKSPSGGALNRNRVRRARDGR